MHIVHAVVKWRWCTGHLLCHKLEVVITGDSRSPPLEPVLVLLSQSGLGWGQGASLGSHLRPHSPNIRSDIHTGSSDMQYMYHSIKHINGIHTVWYRLHIAA